jgi:microcystin-dependent protein
MDELTGVFKLFAGNFPPRDYMFCDGRVLRIATFPTLFTILGTTYGGDGRRTFALPDLRGCVPVGAGDAPGLSSYLRGERGGEETHTLVLSELPAHNHGVNAVGNAPNVGSPTNSMPANGSFYNNGTSTTTMNRLMIAPAGGNRPHNNIQPYLSLHYIICVAGTMPSH